MSKPHICKVFSIDIDFFGDVCLLKTPSIKAVNSLGESGSAYLTALFIAKIHQTLV